LEALAQVHPLETKPIARLIQNESQNLAWGSTVVVISAMPTDALVSTLVRMKRGGRRVTLIVIGGSEPPVSRDGLTVYHIRDDVIWHDLETLDVQGE
jgi:hypothetical protein